MLQRLTDHALFTAAFAAAAILLVLGVREVRRRSRSRIANRFLMYLSAALVIVGGSLVPTAGRGAAADSAWAQDAGQRPAAPKSWSEIRATWDAVWKASEQPGEADAAGLSRSIEKAKTSLKALQEAKSVSSAMVEFVSAALDSRLSVIRQEKVEQDKEIGEHIRLLGLARGAASNARKMKVDWLTDPLIQAARGTFADLRRFPLGARLKASKMGRDEYRAMVLDLVDVLHAIFLSGAAGRTPPVGPPIPVTEYGIRPMPPVPPASKLPPVLVREIRGEVRYRVPGMEWIALAPKAQLTTPAVLENTRSEEAVVVLSNGMEVKLGSEEIRTGWELDPRIPAGEALDRRIEALIRDLGSDQIEAREEATKTLQDIGLAAVPALEKALRSDDSEVQARAQVLLDAIRSKQGDPILDSFKPPAAPPSDDDLHPYPLTKYGIRPDR